MQTDDFNDENSQRESYEEFKRANLLKAAKAAVASLECDYMPPCTDKAELKDLCKRANVKGLGAIIVYPAYVKLCVGYLGSDPQTSLIASVSSPHGCDCTEVKVAAIKRAVKDGVDEVEVFATMPMIKDGNWLYFKRECKKLKKAAKIRALRIVLDCGLLTEKEVLKAAEVSAACNVNMLRLHGAADDTIEKVKSAVRDRCLIKADGCESVSRFNELSALGVNAVSCRNALQFAEQILLSAAK